MKHLDPKSLGIDVAQIEKDLAEGWSFPTHWYYDPDHYQFELDEIYGKSWQYVAPLHKLQKPGDTVVGKAGSVPVVITRDKNGKIHGFVNACRHRGYAVATEDRPCRTLVCKYHNWSYALDGSLLAAGGSQCEPGFDKSELSLLPVAVDIWGPAVFVNLDTNAKSFLETHPNFEANAIEMGFPVEGQAYLDKYEMVREVKFEFSSNWKLWYDNNTECYHCPTIHSGTFNEAFSTDKDAARVEQMDDMLLFSFPPSEDKGDPNALRSSEQHAIQVFPGFAIMRQDDIMTLLQTIPTGPESACKMLHIFGERSADPARVEAWADVWKATFEEDQEATIVQQEHIRSGKLPKFRFMTNEERATVYVSQLVWKAYKRALGVTD